MAFYYATASEAEACVAIVGIPLDRTSSFIPGTRFGPDVARIGADNIESFSPFQLRDVNTVAVCDQGNIALEYARPTAPLEQIAATTRRNLAAGRRQVAIGGEHTITPAIVGELARSLTGLHVIQFDAHSDLRDDFLGEKNCHATAMRRVLDHVPREQLFQLGIRSFSAPAEIGETNLTAFEVLKPISAIRKAIDTRPVYITIDVDVLDPAFLSEVQTPQPGGCSYLELARALAGLAGLDIVGVDIVEFCPRNSQPGPGAALVAELVREAVLLVSVDRAPA
uniref:Agmatinase n=1 Tax=candidate division WOR-3 bacterium TaxID=2052148 RepID=A0A7C4CB76_UNCW3